MPSYRILLKASAEKEMNALPTAIHARVSTKILSLKFDPRPPGSQKLHGKDGHRIRVGDYRILYTIEDDSLTVIIFSVAHRREAYR